MPGTNPFAPCSFRAVTTGRGFAIAGLGFVHVFRKDVYDAAWLAPIFSILGLCASLASAYAAARCIRLAFKRARISSAAATSALARCRTGSFGLSSATFFLPR